MPSIKGSRTQKGAEHFLRFQDEGSIETFREWLHRDDTYTIGPDTLTKDDDGLPTGFTAGDSIG